MGDGRFGAWITWITNLIIDNSKSWMVSLQLLALRVCKELKELFSKLFFLMIFLCFFYDLVMI